LQQLLLSAVLPAAAHLCLLLTLLVLVLLLLLLLQSPTTGPELFVEVLGTLAAACDALSNSSSEDGGSSSNHLGQLLPIDELLRLLQACFTPGGISARRSDRAAYAMHGADIFWTRSADNRAFVCLQYKVPACLFSSFCIAPGSELARARQQVSLLA
jgi:hypothetical protein